MMKKTLFVLASLLTLAGVARGQTVSLTINAGLLENTAGTAVVPNGGLLQLIASPGGTFSAPTSTSYVGGDNVVVASFAMNSNGGPSGDTSGFTVNTLSSLLLTTSNYTLAAGESLLLRFYPDLTYSGMPSAPTLGTTYGQVRSSTNEYSTTVDSTETPWFVPSAGSTNDLDYVTMSAAGSNGTYANSTAYATNTVLLGVPEPSTYALLAGASIGLLACRACNRRRSHGLHSAA